MLPDMAFDKKAYQKAYNKKYRESHREYFREKTRVWSKANPERGRQRSAKYVAQEENRLKTLARSRVQYAVRTGKLVRPEKCENCFTKCKPEADHHDYSDPLSVRWLCKPCHTEVTIGRKRANLLL